MEQRLARTSEWSNKILALARGGKTEAAVAQIRVAPSVKELKQLEAALVAAGLTGRWRDVDAAVTDNLALLSAPRLHRSP